MVDDLPISKVHHLVLGVDVWPLHFYGMQHVEEIRRKKRSREGE
jgi:hypothetical protein